MHKITRVCLSVLLLTAAVLGAGCGFISEGKFNPDKIWLNQPGESQ